MRLGGKPVGRAGQCRAASATKAAPNTGRRTEFRDRALRDGDNAILERHENVRWGPAMSTAAFTVAPTDPLWFTPCFEANVKPLPALRRFVINSVARKDAPNK